MTIINRRLTHTHTHTTHPSPLHPLLLQGVNTTSEKGVKASFEGKAGMKQADDSNLHNYSSYDNKGERECRHH